MLVDICWSKDQLLPDNYQTKKFETVDKAVAWCRKNFKNIFSINGHATYCTNISHLLLVDYLCNAS